MADAPGYPDALPKNLGQVGTDLDPFSEGEMTCPENQGYAVANVAVLRWIPAVVLGDPPPFQWPHADHVDQQSVQAALKDASRRGVIQDLWRSLKSCVSDWLDRPAG